LAGLHSTRHHRPRQPVATCCAGPYGRRASRPWRSATGGGPGAGRRRTGSGHPRSTTWPVSAGSRPRLCPARFARPRRVNAETEARIRAAARRLGYRANPLARAAADRQDRHHRVAGGRHHQLSELRDHPGRGGRGRRRRVHDGARRRAGVAPHRAGGHPARRRHRRGSGAQLVADLGLGDPVGRQAAPHGDCESSLSGGALSRPTTVAGCGARSSTSASWAIRR
jgi:hypothetical protein